MQRPTLTMISMSVRLRTISAAGCRRCLSTTNGFHQGDCGSSSNNPPQRRGVSKLILVRHGQSTWNATPTFTGWCDAPLTPQGMAQAQATGQLLKQRGIRRFDHIFTSQLSRAYITSQLVCAAAFVSSWEGFHSKNYHTAWQLNERHYGALQGLRKDDPSLIDTYGAEQMRSWRRDFHSVPPPLDGSHPYYQPPPAPLTESLEHCQQRVVEYFQSSIRPTLMQDGNDDQYGSDPSASGTAGVEGGINGARGSGVKEQLSKDKYRHPCRQLFRDQNRNTQQSAAATASKASAQEDPTILLVAHSNTLRALIAYFEDMPEHQIPNLHIPNSVPCVYSFDSATGEILTDTKKQWMWSHENYERLHAKVSSQEYIQSMLQSILMHSQRSYAAGYGMMMRQPSQGGTDDDGKISKHQLEVWLIDQMGSDDIAMGALAGKLWEELHHLETDSISIEELEKYLQRSGHKLNLPFLMNPDEDLALSTRRSVDDDVDDNVASAMV